MTKYLVNILFAWICTFYFTAAVQADDQAYNQSGDRPMLHGYDPVSYFDGQPAQGNEANSLSYQRKIFHFKNAENKQRFLEDPERYQPSYGGYCAFGVRMAKKFDIDPSAYAIVDGRLYVLLNRATLGVWQEDIAGNIQIANNNWPKIEGVAPQLL